LLVLDLLIWDLLLLLHHEELLENIGVYILLINLHLLLWLSLLLLG